MVKLWHALLLTHINSSSFSEERVLWCQLSHLQQLLLFFFFNSLYILSILIFHWFVWLFLYLYKSTLLSHSAFKSNAQQYTLIICVVTADLLYSKTHKIKKIILCAFAFFFFSIHTGKNWTWNNCELCLDKCWQAFNNPVISPLYCGFMFLKNEKCKS